MDIWSVCALVCSLGGNILVNYKKRIGFIVWLISNILWIAVNLRGDTNWCQIVMFLVYMCLNIQGFIQWGKMGRK